MNEHSDAAEVPDVDWKNSEITDADVAHLRSHLHLRREMRPWNSEVTTDNIWHFANGVGDDNPLWWDKAYAENSCWGKMIAPPCFFYSCTNGGQDPKDVSPFGTDGFLPGILGLWASSRWRWYRPAPIGEKVRLFWQIDDVIDVPNSKFGGRAVDQVDRTTFTDASGEPFAEVWRTIKRFSRKTARETKRYGGRALAKFTAEDRDRFAKQYDAEPEMRRGSRPLYIEDVHPGDKLGPMLKGPLTLTNMVGWLLGWGSGFCQTNRIAHEFLKHHPGSRIFNEAIGCEDTIEAPHWDERAAQQGGYPTGYDFGSQRISWLAHLVSDWAGDDSFMTELEVKLLKPNLLGDVTWISGEVLDVRANGHVGEARCKLTAVNQLDEVTAAAVAIVQLPSRASGRPLTSQFAT